MAPSQESPAGSATSASAQDPRAQGASASNMAQAYRDLDRGEKAAALLEVRLAALEGHLDEMFASLESMGAGAHVESDEEDGKKKLKDAGKAASKPDCPPVKGGDGEKKDCA